MSQTTVSAPRLSGPAQQLDDYLQQQMRKASAQVRLVDLFTSIMTLLAVFLGALFLIALMDAWVFELKPWMRASALGLIVVSAIAYILIVIVLRGQSRRVGAA
jgi:divalent metal cation (Fe/Co/Zn/Cd) transporter